MFSISLPTTKVILGYEDEPQLQFLFGALVERAQPIISAYRGDLYQDAMRLASYVKDGATFYWGCRETGTSLGFGEDEVASWNDVSYKVTVERVVSRHADQRWEATITPIPAGISNGKNSEVVA